MPPTRSEVLSFQKRVERQAQDINLELLKTATVRAVELTGHPGWDQFLAQLQAMLDQAERELVQWTENCVNAMKEDDMRFAQRNVTAYQVQVKLLKTIMALPQNVIKESHAARPE